jgi:hypothetical protein
VTNPLGPTHTQKATIKMASAAVPQDGPQADVAGNSLTLDTSDVSGTPAALLPATSAYPTGEKEILIATAYSAIMNDPFLQRKWLTD